MKLFFRALFFTLITVSLLSYLFYQKNAIEQSPKKSVPAEHKISKVEIPKPPLASAPSRRLRKTSALEKPSSVTSTPFAGLKSFGNNGDSGLISQSDQLASASTSFANSKSSQTSDVQLLTRTDPVFPNAAKRKNITGYVRLLITVDQSSAIKSIDVIESSPEGYFENAAIDAVKNWKFAAAYQSGSPVESSIKRKIEFKLE